ncbi:MAG: DUF2288 domain-containing protein [Spirulinaceae cyanobacterium]
MSDLREEIAQSLDEAAWDWLMPHARRDALIVVSPSLDLLDVGVEIAQDNTPQIQTWITKKLIQKPSVDQLTLWNKTPQKRFNAIIVQPFVVVQEQAVA